MQSNDVGTGRRRPLRLFRAGVICFLAILGAVYFQMPGCGPQQESGIGGLTETIMVEGKLTPVTLRFLDDGQPTPVRVYFYWNKQRSYILGPEVGWYFPLFTDRFWQDKYFPVKPGIPILDMAHSQDHHYYFLTGEATVPLVPGRYEVVAYKGMEYLPEHLEFTVGAEPVVHEVAMQRWKNMQTDGWYSGDTHLHLSRMNKEDPIYLAMQEADGVHVGHYIQLQLLWQGAVQKSFGKQSEVRRGNIMLRSGEESRSAFGHTMLLGIDRLVLPVGQDWNDHQQQLIKRLHHDLFAESRSVGGMNGYAHGDGLNRTSAAAIDLPFGIVDFVEILQFCRVKTEFWYEALSAGFRLPPSAGTDFPAHLRRWDPWPPLWSPLSGDRMYVQVAGEFSFETWMEGFRQGRVFLTTGPMVDFKVNGTGPGGEVRIPDTAQSVDLALEIHHWRPMKEARLLIDGRVERVYQNTDRQTRWTITESLPVNKSTWMAVYVESDSTGPVNDDDIPLRAHTGAVYVLKGEQPVRSESAVNALIQRVRVTRDYFATTNWKFARPGMKEELLDRCDEAIARYTQLLKNP